MAQLPLVEPLAFLSGGGEMGARMRSFDWSTTALGAPAVWPQPLRTLVGVMLGSGQSMFVAWGPERTMLYNDGYAPLCGAKHPCALGRPFAEVWADIIADVGPIMDRAYAGIPTHTEDIQVTLIDRRGYPEETHFAFSFTPVRDEAGVVAGIFCACTDTTERVFTDRRLRFLVELSDRLRDAADARDIMAAAVSFLGTYLAVDRAGYAEFDEAGESYTVSRDWTNGTLASMAGTGRLAEFEPFASDLRAGHVVRSDDVETDARARRARQAFAAIGVRSCINIPLMKDYRCVAALFLHQAQPRTWQQHEAALACDVAARTWDAVGRARSEQKLRDADARKNEFLAILAHELRNPLAPLRTGLEILKMADADPAAAARVHGMMDRQLGHMVRLIDDLLDLSRMRRGLIELRKERIDLKEIVASAVETSLPLIEGGHHELAVSLPSDALPVDADPTRLAQVLSNLLNNAAKYTPSGGRITLEAVRADDDIVIRVTDTGIGIPSEMLHSVFEMFTQAGRDAERGQGGLGIGLTLVRRLTEMHGGTVGVQSSAAGSTFTVRLPRATVSGRSTPPHDQASARQPCQGSLRVLVVDDDADAVGMLSMLIELQGHQTACAYHGAEAVRTAEAFDPHVVFLDIGLPGLDGYAVARELRQRPGGDDVLLVALTGWGSDEDKQRTQDAGFDHHLTKPVDPAAVEALLSRAAEGRRARG